MPQNDTELRQAARDLISLNLRCPALFRHVLPIDDDTMQTLIELAEYDDFEEEPPDAAE